MQSSVWKMAALMGLLLGAPQARAQVLVVGDGQEAYKEALAGIRERIPAASALAPEGAAQHVRAGDVVVALGDQAAAVAYGSGSPMVVGLLSDPSMKMARPCVRVSSLPDAFFLVEKVRDLVPELTHLAVFGVGDHYQSYAKFLGSAGAITSIKIMARSINKPSDLVEALRSLPGHAEALWLAPEPTLLGRDTFNFISEFCRQNHIALIAPVAGLAKVGAVVGLSPSFKEIGRAAGKAAAALAAGTAANGLVTVDRCEVLVSVSAARALGLDPGPRLGQRVD